MLNSLCPAFSVATRLCQVDFRHRSELTPGVSVSPKDQHHCDSGYFLCDCAVNAMSVCGLKSLVGELVQGSSLKDNIYNGGVSAAENF